MADRAVLKRNSTSPLRLSSSATIADRAVLKRWCVPYGLWLVQQPWQIKWFSNDLREGSNDEAFSNHGRSSGSQTTYEGTSWVNTFSNHGRSSGSQTHGEGGRRWRGSVTMADQVVLKPVGVDMPFELGIPISKNCKICQVFLFLRPARSFFRSGSRISASVYSRPDGGMGTL